MNTNFLSNGFVA
jgi:hypothetical protein